MKTMNKTESKKLESAEEELPVICSSFLEILEMLNRGKSIFEFGYLQTLGEMQRQGLIQVELFKDGSAVVRKNCP